MNRSTKEEDEQAEKERKSHIKIQSWREIEKYGRDGRMTGVQIECKEKRCGEKKKRSKERETELMWVVEVYELLKKMETFEGKKIK